MLVTHDHKKMTYEEEQNCSFNQIGNESTDQESSIKRLINNEVVFLNSDYSNSFSTSVLIKKNVIFTEKYFFKTNFSATLS